MDRAALRNYLLEKLRDPGTYVTAFVVGTLINLYGHVLVPWLRGRPQTLDGFLAELRAEPGLMTTSILLGYVFPVIVGTHAAVVTRYRGRRLESRALFPDNKPDPVFRVTMSGEITEAGAATEALFSRHGVRHASDILGAEGWDEVRSAAAQGASRQAELRIFFEPEQSWYLVGYSPAPPGALNLYLTRLAPPQEG